jgi:putative transposase
MMFPLVADLAADSIPVAVTCRVLGFSKQAFYQWRADPVSQRDWDEAHLINAAIDIHHDDPEFGYRFITDELAGLGITASRNRVNRLCTQQRIFSSHASKRGAAPARRDRRSTTTSSSARSPPPRPTGCG